jgi:hypothetical protein
MASGSTDGTQRVFYEVFHETSNGDFGIEPKDGPLLRAHTHILTTTPGFIGKVRRLGRPRNRAVEDDGPGTSKNYFKEHGLTRLLEDATFVQSSQPLSHSALFGKGAFGVQHADPMMPGYTTRTLLSGDTAAFRRIDQFFLAERYEIDCDVERLCEMLRFIYQGYTSYFDIRPQNDAERTDLTHKMLEICKDSERFSCDGLFEKTLTWFGRDCFGVCGEKNFANAFYHLQHYEVTCTEDLSREKLRATVSGKMLENRSQFRAITQDPRWNFLPVDFVEHTLNYDTLPISSEIEILNLIERWNANADKPKNWIVQLLGCFRPDEKTQQTLESWLSAQGWLNADGSIADIPELEPLRMILGGNKKGKKKRIPRRFQGEAQFKEAQKLDEDAQKAAKDQAEADTSFEQWKNGVIISKGSSFSLGSRQRLVQTDVIRSSGIQRLRVVLSNPRSMLWDPEHQVFVGISYGEGKYFGYLCRATAFSGIFSVQALASAAPAPNAPVHLTGSGYKVEFDIALEVQLQRVNLVVCCKLSIIFKNETITEELFQIASETLREGAGLRYQVVGTNLREELIDVSLTCVSGGGFDETKELNAPPEEF